MWRKKLEGKRKITYKNFKYKQFKLMLNSTKS